MRNPPGRDSDPLGRHRLSPAELQVVQAHEDTTFVAWRNPGAELRLVRLAPTDGSVLIGRHEDCAIRVEWDRYVHRHHAALRPIGDLWEIDDLKSDGNGTRVAGSRIDRRLLTNHDLIDVGQTTITFRTGSVPGGVDTLKRDPAPEVIVAPSTMYILIRFCAPQLADPDAAPPTNAEIAAQADVSVDTVKYHLKKLYQQFGIAVLDDDATRRRALATAAIARHVVTDGHLRQSR